jgi:hypothetical protein
MLVRSKKNERNVGMTETEQIQAIVREYVCITKKWQDDDYQIDFSYAREKEGNYLVTVVHKADLDNPIPGGGKSIQLRIDLRNKKVIQELAFQ